MKLIKASLVSTAATLAKMAIGFIALKIIALYLGPTGVALCGQFTSLLNIITVIAGGGISIGIIKYVAEYADSSQKLQNFLGNAALYTAFFSLVTMLLGVVFNQILAQWIMGSHAYAYLILWIAFGQFFIAAYILTTSVLSGFKRIALLAKINVINALVGVTIMLVLVKFFALKGALIALVVSQACYLLVALAFIYREKWLIYLSKFKFDWQSISGLSRYSLMNSVSVLTIPIAQIIVRNDLSHLFSWQGVGYWQAVMRLSDAYILLMTTVFTSYYLPRLAEIHDKRMLKQEIFYTCKIILPSLLLIVGLIYLLRDLIIKLVFSADFLPARDLFLYQFVGDFFKIAGWLSACLFLAKLRMKTYIIGEIITSILFVVLSYLLARKFGLVGVTYAFATTYFLYWLLMLGASVLYFKQMK